MLNFYFLFAFTFYFTICQGALSTTPINEIELKARIESDSMLLALFCEKEVDAHCLQIDQRIQQALAVTNVNGLKSVVVLDSAIPKQYQLGSLPQVIFYRNTKPILYYADATNNMDLGEWLERNQEVSIKELNEDNFEHDTQASSGATTGDWFIMFYDSSECNWFIPTWDALASRLKQRLVVGAVDIKANTKLKDRFKLDKCLTLIFFRLGSMYEYNLKAKDIPSLASFAEGWYKNVQAVKVPTEATPFDQMTEKIATALKDERTRNIAIGVGGSVLLLVIVIIFCSVMTSGKKEKAKKE